MSRYPFCQSSAARDLRRYASTLPCRLAGRDRAMKQCRFFLLFAFLIGVTEPRTMAQTYLQSQAVPPAGGTVPVELGYVNLLNGSLNLQIPLGSYPQRGGGRGLVALNYSSNFGFDTFDNGTGAGVWIITNNNWALSSPSDPAYALSPAFQLNVRYDGECDSEAGIEPNYIVYTGFSFTAPDGTSQTWPLLETDRIYDPANCGGDGIPNASGYDNEGYYLSITSYVNAIVTGPDGTVYNLIANTITDPNGNQYSQADPPGTYSNVGSYDSLKRRLVQHVVSGGVDYLSIPNAEGGTSTYAIKGTSVDISTNFGGPTAQFTGTRSEISEIDLPDGTSYHFTYDSGTTPGHYGELLSMTLPTGGTIYYTWSIDNDTGPTAVWLTKRTTPDSSVGWTYSLPSFSNNHISHTVTAPSGDYTVYTFGGPTSGPFPVEAQYYDATSTSLGTSWACYSDGYNNPNTTNSACPTAASLCVNVKNADIVTMPTPGGSVTAMKEYTCDQYANQTKVQEWKYGSSLSGAADRITNTSFYHNGYVVDKPQVITVTDGSGGFVAETDNAYDGTTLVTTGATGIVNHDDTNYGSGFSARGNLTQVKRYTNSTSYVTQSMTYDITGQRRTLTDGNTNLTTYSYTDNFFNDAGDTASAGSYSPTTGTNAYLTSETVASGTALAETSTRGYYFGTGQLARITDPNTQSTYFHFYDPLSRRTSTKYPDSGWSYSVYPSGS